MCLFIFLNKFIISFLFSVYIPSLFLPKPCRAPHSENLLAFKIHLHWIIYSFDKVLFCLIFIFFNNKKPGWTFPKDQKRILVFKDARQPWPKCTKQALGALSFVIWVFSPLLNILSSECVVGEGKVNKALSTGSIQNTIMCLSSLANPFAETTSRPIMILGVHEETPDSDWWAWSHDEDAQLSTYFCYFSFYRKTTSLFTFCNTDFHLLAWIFPLSSLWLVFHGAPITDFLEAS